jgi:hypothetical protein
MTYQHPEPDEIEVTAEMLRAGGRVMDRNGFITHDGSDDEVLTEVFREMVRHQTERSQK